MGRCQIIMSGLLTGLLAFVFITAGTIKVTPKLSVEAHKRVVSIIYYYRNAIHRSLLTSSNRP